MGIQVMGILLVIVIVLLVMVFTYYRNTSRERLNKAVSDSTRSIESQFERPPNENDLI